MGNVEARAIEAKAINKYYFSTRDLVVMATLAAVQVVISVSTVPFVRQLMHGVLHLPGPGAGQAILGGFLYVMWAVLAYGVTQKRGSALVTSIFMGIVGIFTGMGPLTGFPVFIMYLVAGVACEIGLLVPKGRYVIATSFAVLAEFLIFIFLMGYVNGQWLIMNWIPIFAIAGIVSGAAFGVVTIGILRSLERAGLVRRVVRAP